MPDLADNFNEIDIEHDAPDYLTDLPAMNMSAIRDKVKKTINPYIESEITGFKDDEENDEQNDSEDDDQEELLSADFNEEEDDDEIEDDDSESLDDWDKWVFNNKLSPPSPKSNYREELTNENIDYIVRFDISRSSHLWKSDPEVSEYRAFGSLREKTNNVLAANLRKYQNESLTTSA